MVTEDCRELIRLVRNTALVLVGLVSLLAVAGATYQFIATRAEARRSPEAGRLVDVGGYRLKINCTGKGAPTVVLEAGLADMSVEWKHVQPEIARFSRVCSYDRAGYGGSDPGPMPRTSAQIAHELHALLQHAGEAPPYLLVGSSFGGYSVRVFNGEYPDEVVGIVLADAPQEDQYALLPAGWGPVYKSMVNRYKKQARWAPAYVDLGVARLTLRLEGASGDESYLILQSKYLRARASELEVIETSAEQARAAGSIADKPLIVLTAGNDSDQMGLSKQDFDDFHRIWVNELQARLAHLSKKGKQIIVPDSGHDIPSDRPDAIVNAVRDIRKAAIPQVSE